MMTTNWRQMRSEDINAVIAIAAAVHPGYPEDDAVLAQKLTLYPKGCLALEVDGDVVGYALSHPWHAGQMPKLNQLFDCLPANPDSYYLHDIALLPRAQGLGAAIALTNMLVDLALRENFKVMQLCAVNGSAPFWRRQGFIVVDAPHLRAALASYGVDVHFMSRDLG